MTCGWTKGPPRHRVTWWWNEEVENRIKEKRKWLVDKETYLVAKMIARTAIYKAKTEAEKARFANIQ